MEALKSHGLFRGRARVQIQVCLPPGSAAFLLQSFKKGGHVMSFWKIKEGVKRETGFHQAARTPEGREPWRLKGSVTALERKGSKPVATRESENRWAIEPNVLDAQSCPTPWTVAHQASLSMGFSRQEYWSGLPFSSPGDLPDPGIKPRSPALQADSSLSD